MKLGRASEAWDDQLQFVSYELRALTLSSATACFLDGTQPNVYSKDAAGSIALGNRHGDMQ